MCILGAGQVRGRMQGLLQRGAALIIVPNADSCSFCVSMIEIQDWVRIPDRFVLFWNQQLHSANSGPPVGVWDKVRGAWSARESGHGKAICTTYNTKSSLGQWEAGSVQWQAYTDVSLGESVAQTLHAHAPRQIV